MTASCRRWRIAARPGTALGRTTRVRPERARRRTRLMAWADASRRSRSLGRAAMTVRLGRGLTSATAVVGAPARRIAVRGRSARTRRPMAWTACLRRRLKAWGVMTAWPGPRPMFAMGPGDALGRRIAVRRRSVRRPGRPTAWGVTIRIALVGPPVTTGLRRRRTTSVMARVAAPGRPIAARPGCVRAAVRPMGSVAWTRRR